MTTDQTDPSAEQALETADASEHPTQMGDGAPRPEAARKWLERLGDAREPVRLSHYVVLHRVGRGGAGVVLAAFDETLDRKVAIKLLRTHGRDEAHQRLLREAKAMARLSHPNVAQVYEIGEVEDLTFIVMEFVEGITLRRWLTEGRRTQQAILTVFSAAGSGLAHAHAAGLVHRDFKPDNVMIRDDGRVLVLDFGIARLDPGPVSSSTDPRGTPEPASTELAEGGEVLTREPMAGTPAYMAPEQFSHQPTDGRTDQFAFCVALWEALYGRRPHEGDSVATLCRAVTRAERTIPEGAGVPAWLHRVLERGLALEPADRWPSMSALLQALAADPTRRRRWLAIGVGSGLLTLAGLGGVLWSSAHARADTLAHCEAEGRAIEEHWNDEVRGTLAAAFEASGTRFAADAWQRARDRMDDYAAHWSALRTEICTDTHVDHRRSVQTSVATVACLEDQRRTFAALVEAWHSPDTQAITQSPLAAATLSPVSVCVDDLWLAQRLQPAPHDREAVDQARARLQRADALQLAGRYEASLAEAQAVLDAAQSLGWRPLHAEAWNAVGVAQVKLGKYAAARDALWQASLEALGGGHDLAALDAASWLVSVEGDRLAHHEDGLRWGERGRMLVERMALGGTLREASLLGSIGTVQIRLGSYEAAAQSLTRGLELERSLLGEDHPSVATALNNLGTLRSKQGARAEALALYRQARTIREQVLGPDHPLVASALVNIGTEQEYAGAVGDALGSYEQALGIWEASLGSEHPNVATVLNNIGSVRTRMGDYDEALVASRRALALFERTLGPEHPTLAVLLTNVANTLRQQGAFEEATQALERGLSISRKALGPEHPQVADVLISLGNLRLEQQRPEQALEQYRAALPILEAALGPDNVRVAGPLAGIGRSLLELQRRAAAREPLERALAICERREASAAARAEAEFLLGRALWAEQPDRARALVEQARRRLHDLGPDGGTDLVEIDAWLASPREDGSMPPKTAANPDGGEDERPRPAP